MEEPEGPSWCCVFPSQRAPRLCPYSGPPAWPNADLSAQRLIPFIKRQITTQERNNSQLKPSSHCKYHLPAWPPQGLGRAGGHRAGGGGTGVHSRCSSSRLLSTGLCRGSSGKRSKPTGWAGSGLGNRWRQLPGQEGEPLGRPQGGSSHLHTLGGKRLAHVCRTKMDGVAALSRCSREGG